ALGGLGYREGFWGFRFRCRLALDLGRLGEFLRRLGGGRVHRRWGWRRGGGLLRKVRLGVVRLLRSALRLLLLVPLRSLVQLFEQLKHALEMSIAVQIRNDD